MTTCPECERLLEVFLQNTIEYCRRVEETCGSKIDSFRVRLDREKEAHHVRMESLDELNKHREAHGIS
jgi:hypothetical protein